MEEGLRALEQGLEDLRQGMRQFESEGSAGPDEIRRGRQQFQAGIDQFQQGIYQFRNSMPAHSQGPQNLRNDFGRGQQHFRVNIDRNSRVTGDFGRNNVPNAYDQRHGPPPAGRRSDYYSTGYDRNYTRPHSPSYDRRRSRSPLRNPIPDRRPRPYQQTRRVHPYARPRPRDSTQQPARAYDGQNSGSDTRREDPVQPTAGSYLQPLDRNMQGPHQGDDSRDAHESRADSQSTGPTFGPSQQAGEQSSDTSGVRERVRTPYAMSGSRRYIG